MPTSPPLSLHGGKLCPHGQKCPPPWLVPSQPGRAGRDLNPGLRLRGRKPCGQEGIVPLPGPPRGGCRTERGSQPATTFPWLKGDLNSPLHAVLWCRQKGGKGSQSRPGVLPRAAALTTSRAWHAAPSTGMLLPTQGPMWPPLACTPQDGPTSACQPSWERPGSSHLLGRRSQQRAPSGSLCWARPQRSSRLRPHLHAWPHPGGPSLGSSG